MAFHLGYLKKWCIPHSFYKTFLLHPDKGLCYASITWIVSFGTNWHFDIKTVIISVQKSVAFLYSNNKLAEREMKETCIDHRIKKKTKTKTHLGINLPKKIKDLYLENYEILMKAIEDDKQMGRCIIFMDWKK